MSAIPQVVSGGCCVGCGACAVVAPEHLEMHVDVSGQYLPRGTGGRTLADVDGALPPVVDAVCPFSPASRDEDAIGAQEFPGADHDPAVGRHRAIVAGHVAAGDFRALGTSGGMTSWVLHRVLTSGLVDGVVHVRSTVDEAAGTFSSYTVSTTADELLSARKSRYHVQTLAGVVADVRARGGRFAFVGVPCFVKAVRLLASEEPAFAEQVGFTVSLVCGHLKSTLFTEYLAANLGVEVDDVDEVDYRHKVAGRPANRYTVSIRRKDGSLVTSGMEKIPMADWGIGLFKLGACDYCDDVVGETADMSCGDAWLPPFMSDWQGANVAVARSEVAAQLLAEGQADGSLDVVPWTASQVAASQDAGLRHRRQGLAVRLANRERNGEWVPMKRVAPDHDALDTPFGTRMLVREQIARTSGPAFLEVRADGDLKRFRRRMAPLVRRYQGTSTATAVRRSGAWMLHRLPGPLERGVRKATGGRRFA